MISFIIPAYNEQELIGSAVQAATKAGQSVGEEFEVIVVNDGSTDRTAEVAEEHGARVVHVEHRQIAVTRNSGAAAAQGDQLIFVDADTVVSEDVVRRVVEAIRGGAVGGGCLFQFDGQVPLFARVTARLTLILFRWLSLCGGCFMFATKHVFDQIGGFDETRYAGEELAMCKALKQRGRFVLLSGYVTTSGRKMRTYSPSELIWLVLRLLIKGRRMVADRRGMDFWYGKRREDSKAVS